MAHTRKHTAGRKPAKRTTTRRQHRVKRTMKGGSMSNAVVYAKQFGNQIRSAASGAREAASRLRTEWSNASGDVENYANRLKRAADQRRIKEAVANMQAQAQYSIAHPKSGAEKGYLSHTGPLKRQELRTAMQQVSTTAPRTGFRGFINRTKKAFGDIKQTISNKMSGVNKFMSLFNNPTSIQLDGVNYNLYAFKADNDRLQECTGYKGMIKKLNNNIKLEENSGLIKGMIKKYIEFNPDIGNLINKLIKSNKLDIITPYPESNDTTFYFVYMNKMLNMENNPQTGSIRIIMYATYDSSQVHNQQQTQVSMQSQQPPVSPSINPNINSILKIGQDLFVVKNNEKIDIIFKAIKYENNAGVIHNILTTSTDMDVCSWEEIQSVLSASRPSDNDISKTIQFIINSNHNRKLLILYKNAEGVIMYMLPPTQGGSSNNKPFGDRPNNIPETVKYVVYAYKPKNTSNTTQGVGTYINVAEVLPPASNAGYMNPDNLGVRPQNPEYMNVSSIRPNTHEEFTEVKPVTNMSQTGQIASTRVG